MRKLPELYEQGYAATDVADGIAMFYEPGDIPLDGFPQPRSANAVNGLGFEEETFQHDNLLFSWLKRTLSPLRPAKLCGRNNRWAPHPIRLEPGPPVTQHRREPSHNTLALECPQHVQKRLLREADLGRCRSEGT